MQECLFLSSATFPLISTIPFNVQQYVDICFGCIFYLQFLRFSKDFILQTFPKILVCDVATSFAHIFMNSCDTMSLKCLLDNTVTFVTFIETYTFITLEADMNLFMLE